jgi:hypothetical protein
VFQPSRICAIIGTSDPGPGTDGRLAVNVQPTNEHIDIIFERYTQAGSLGCAVALTEDGAATYKYVPSQFTPLFADAFSDDWLPIMEYPSTYLVVFERDKDGEITGLRVSGSRVRHLWFGKEGTGDD